MKLQKLKRVFAITILMIMLLVPVLSISAEAAGNVSGAVGIRPVFGFNPFDLAGSIKDLLKDIIKSMIGSPASKVNDILFNDKSMVDYFTVVSGDPTNSNIQKWFDIFELAGLAFMPLIVLRAAILLIGSFTNPSDRGVVKEFIKNVILYIAIILFAKDVIMWLIQINDAIVALFKEASQGIFGLSFDYNQWSIFQLIIGIIVGAGVWVLSIYIWILLTLRKVIIGFAYMLIPVGAIMLFSNKFKTVFKSLYDEVFAAVFQQAIFAGTYVLLYDLLIFILQKANTSDPDKGIILWGLITQSAKVTYEHAGTKDVLVLGPLGWAILLFLLIKVTGKMKELFGLTSKYEGDLDPGKLMKSGLNMGTKALGIAGGVAGFALERGEKYNEKKALKNVDANGKLTAVGQMYDKRSKGFKKANKFQKRFGKGVNAGMRFFPGIGMAVDNLDTYDAAIKPISDLKDAFFPGLDLAALQTQWYNQQLNPQNANPGGPNLPGGPNPQGGPNTPGGPNPQRGPNLPGGPNPQRGPNPPGGLNPQGGLNPGTNTNNQNDGNNGPGLLGDDNTQDIPKDLPLPVSGDMMNKLAGSEDGKFKFSPADGVFAKKMKDVNGNDSFEFYRSNGELITDENEKARLLGDVANWREFGGKNSIYGFGNDYIALPSDFRQNASTAHNARFTPTDAAVNMDMGQLTDVSVELANAIGQVKGRGMVHINGKEALVTKIDEGTGKMELVKSVSLSNTELENLKTYVKIDGDGMQTAAIENLGGTVNFASGFTESNNYERIGTIDAVVNASTKQLRQRRVTLNNIVQAVDEEIQVLEAESEEAKGNEERVQVIQSNIAKTKTYRNSIVQERTVVEAVIAEQNNIDEMLINQGNMSGSIGDVNLEAVRLGNESEVDRARQEIMSASQELAAAVSEERMIKNQLDQGHRVEPEFKRAHEKVVELQQKLEAAREHYNNVCKEAFGK